MGTGLETQVARDSGMVPITRVNGTVTFVDATAIVIRDEEGTDHVHHLQKYQPPTRTPVSTSVRSSGKAIP